MEDGKRLENLSWRLWNRETFCCAPDSKSPAPAALEPRCSFSTKPHAATGDIPMPELSSSLDSAVSEELDDDETSSAPVATATATATAIPKARPELKRHDSSSYNSSRGREKHITPVDLEKMVQSIKESKLEPIEISLPTPSSRMDMDPPSTSASQHLPQLHSEQNAEQDASRTTQHSRPPASASHATLESSASTVDTTDTTDTNDTSKSSQTQVVGSDDSSNTEMSTHSSTAGSHSVVRGFVPGGAPSSYRSQTHLAAQPTPILKTSPQYQQPSQKKKGAMFTIGTSSGEDESSFEKHMSFKSSLSERLKSGQGSSDSKKKASFKDEVAVAQESPVFESDDEDDEVSESAIEEDDDSSDWEDSDEQSGPSSVNEKEMFQRVDSRPNLTSRRSMLTTLMNEPDRAKALQNAASRSTPALRRSRTSTPNGPSCAASPLAHSQTAEQEGQDAPRSNPKPIIMTTSNTHPPQQPALSPRTTRRNMLSTELTESLRKNLLWERQHRSTGNLAAMKRRHTAQDMTKLKQHPEPVAMSQQNPSNFSNDYFHAGLQEYHAKGW